MYRAHIMADGTKNDLLFLTPQWAREMAVTRPIFLHWGRKGQKALPHVATLGSAAVAAKMVAGAMAATGVTAAAAAGLGGGKPLSARAARQTNQIRHGRTAATTQRPPRRGDESHVWRLVDQLPTGLFIRCVL